MMTARLSAGSKLVKGTEKALPDGWEFNEGDRLVLARICCDEALNATPSDRCQICSSSTLFFHAHSATFAHRRWCGNHGRVPFVISGLDLTRCLTCSSILCSASSQCISVL